MKTTSNDISLIAAEYGGISSEVGIYPNFEWGVTHKTEEYLKFSPLGNVPAMKTPEGGVFESLAIARYIARAGNDSGLVGTDNNTTSNIDAWLDLISDLAGHKVYSLFAFKYEDWESPFNQEKFDEAVTMSKKLWDVVGKHMERNNQNYLVGDRVTLADIVFAGYFVYPLRFALGAEFRNEFPKVVSYLNKLYESKEFKAVIGDVQFIEKFEQ